MNAVEMLARQTEDVYDWTNKVLNSIPQEKWDEIPEVVDTNVTWQAGHLIMSFYFHSIMVISGHQMDILQKIPLKDYDALFVDAPARNSVGKVTPETLFAQLQLMQQKSLEIIRSLSVEDLEKPLKPSPTPHPIANTQFEAIDWNIKHTMWHCGQLGILKRIVHERYNFGLKRG